jgi:hypothetical protein
MYTPSRSTRAQIIWAAALIAAIAVIAVVLFGNF